MSEILKNIETCRGEDVLAEVSALPQDPHFGSLVNEALDPLKQQALHQAGYDGYSEVIEQHKPYTFASAIVQMKSNLLLLLRALWQFPFGSGTLRSLSDMWQHYITRLSGNETYGIPSRLSSLTDLPSAPILVADRKISGVPEAEDGMSLVHLLSLDVAQNVPVLYDDNYGWILDAVYPVITNIFPNLDELHIGAEKIVTDGFAVFSGDNKFKRLIFDNLTTFTQPNASTVYGWDMIIRNCNTLEELIADKLSYIQRRPSWQGSGGMMIGDTPNLKRLVIGYVTYFNVFSFVRGVPKLIDLEIKGANVSLKFHEWNPSYVLSDNPSGNDLVTDECIDTNIDQFLQNFRSHIALRLATFASNGPTLTLSQAVYDAIKDESHLFVFDEGTMTIYAYLTNIKHWTVTK